MICLKSIMFAGRAEPVRCCCLLAFCLLSLNLLPFSNVSLFAQNTEKAEVIKEAKKQDDNKAELAKTTEPAVKTDADKLPARSNKPPAEDKVSAEKDDKKAASDTPVNTAELVAKLDQQLLENSRNAMQARGELSDLQRQVFDLNLKMNFIDGQLQSLDKSRADHQQQIEKLLVESGQWVSFSKSIAPIFRDRCLTCHNARNPKGQYNMSSFGHIMTTGESGSIVVPGKSADSRLFQVIADHSMPPDADPLTDQEIELVRKWIDIGARLDTSSSADAALFRIAPRPVHPTAPEKYPSPLPISALAFDPSGSMLASSGYHEVLLWSLADGKLLRRIPNVAERVYAISFLPDGKRLAVASGTPGSVGEAKIFEAETGELFSDLLISQDSALALAISPDGKRLAVGEASGAIELFSVKEKSVESIRRIEDHSDWINGLAWSSDGRLLASASRDKTCKVFDVDAKRSILTFGGHQSSVNAVLFRDAKNLISLGEDKRVRIWSIDEGKQSHEIKDLPNASGLLATINGKSIAIAGASNGLIQFDPASAKKGKALKSSLDRIGSIAVSPDRRSIALGSLTGQIEVLQLSPTSEEASQTRVWAAIP